MHLLASRPPRTAEPWSESIGTPKIGTEEQTFNQKNVSFTKSMQIVWLNSGPAGQ